MIAREVRLEPHARVPAIGQGNEVRIEPAPQFGDEPGQGIGEVAVLALSVTVPRHHHLAAEPFRLVVEGRHGGAFLRGQQARQQGVALRGQGSAGDLLELVRTGRATTRGALQQATGLSRATVGQRLDRLFRAGWLREGAGGPVDSPLGGRPSITLEFDDAHAVVSAT